MSAAAARASRIVPCETPTSAKPATTSDGGLELAAERGRQAAGDPRDAAAGEHRDPPEPVHQPSGREAPRARPAVRKIAGPSPRIPSIPVTRTSVTVADGDRELHHPGQARQRRREQHGVAADREALHRASLYFGRDPRRVTVRGHVQGVFFRETTRRRAQARGVAGWVANKPDGSVEAVLEGEHDAVEALVGFIREGPRGARVDWVDVEHEEPEGLTGFEIPLTLSARGRRPCRPARPAGRRAC